MRANRRSNTKPEVSLRSLLHREGLRFRKDHGIDAGSVRVRADIVFPRQRLAVFVDGCYWHRCPEHFLAPKRNQHYWLPKMQRNVDRDRAVDAALTRAGWTVLRIWEHVPLDEAADCVKQSLQRVE